MQLLLRGSGLHDGRLPVLSLPERVPRAVSEWRARREARWVVNPRWSIPPDCLSARWSLRAPLQRALSWAGISADGPLAALSTQVKSVYSPHRSRGLAVPNLHRQRCPQRRTARLLLLPPPRPA